MKDTLVSLIIPVYNREKTIGETLDSVSSMNYKKYEIITVDGGSTDRTVSKIREFTKKNKNIKLYVEKGSSKGGARNLGAEKAKGEILIFVDSDVIIPKDAIPLILNSFKKERDTVAVVGLFSSDCRPQNFVSIYKNLHMHHTLVKLPKYIDTVVGALFAIKKNVFIKSGGFNKKLAYVEDIEFGQRLSKMGYKIHLNKKLEVMHLKRFSFRNLLKNDFEGAVHWIWLLLKDFNTKKVIKQKRFTDKTINFILNVPVSYLLLLSLILSVMLPVFGIISAILFILFLFLDLGFLKLVQKKKGIKFSLFSIPIRFIDMLSVGAGVFIGTLKYLRRKGDVF